MVYGRLLSIDHREQPIKGDQKVIIDQLSIVTDTGEVRVFDLNPTTSVRIAEKDVNEEVGKYLNLVASTRDQDVRRMAISNSGRWRPRSIGRCYPQWPSPAAAACLPLGRRYGRYTSTLELR